MKKFAWLYIVILLMTLLAACGTNTTPGQPGALTGSTGQGDATPAAGSPGDNAIMISAHPPSTPTRPAPTATATPNGSKPPAGNNGGTSPAPPAPSGASSLEQQLFQQINRDRAANNLPAYTWEPRLQKSGYQHNLIMAGGCGLNHQCSGEPGLGTRVSNQGVVWNACGENIGTGGPVQSSDSSRWGMASLLHKDMMAEKPPDDGHRKNLLSSSFHRIGISIYIDARNTLWLTEDFAN